MSFFNGMRKNTNSAMQSNLKSNAMKNFLQSSPEPRQEIPGVIRNRRKGPVATKMDNGISVQVNPITGHTSMFANDVEENNPITKRIGQSDPEKG